LDQGKGEDIIVTHDSNSITFRAIHDKFKAKNHLDLSELAKIGQVSNIFDLKAYLVVQMH